MASHSLMHTPKLRSLEVNLPHSRPALQRAQVTKRPSSNSSSPFRTRRRRLMPRNNSLSSPKVIIYFLIYYYLFNIFILFYFLLLFANITLSAAKVSYKGKLEDAQKATADLQSKFDTLKKTHDTADAESAKATKVIFPPLLSLASSPQHILTYKYRPLRILSLSLQQPKPPKSLHMVS